MSWLEDIKTLKLPGLRAGNNNSPSEGLCAMEMVAFIERLPHSDSPSCTCRVIAAYVRGINDGMPDSERHRLLPYLPRLVGTVSPEHERERAEYLAWQAVRVFAPKALDAVGLTGPAERFRKAASLKEAAEAAWAARAAARAARAAEAAETARSAAWEAAWEAAEAVGSANRMRAETGWAAWAASAAARATSAAARATSAAARATTWDDALSALDGVLAIGPQGDWTQYEVERVMELAE